MKSRLKILPLIVVLSAAACASPAPAPQPTVIKELPGQIGMASWYGPGLHGGSTANGETFDENVFTAAHRTFPLPSLVQVTNLSNGKQVVVRVNDRGPFSKGRLIDLSRAAARALGFEQDGHAKVKVSYLGPAPEVGVKTAER